MEYKIEHDSLGEVRVPKDRYWGAQTQRSFENFPIGTEKMPKEIIRAFAILKKSAAFANATLGRLDEKRRDAIAKAADEILAGDLDGHFSQSTSPSPSGRRAAARSRT